jgi:hypothetical protein
MKWNLFLPLLVTALLAVSSWFAAHRLASARDRTTKRRETRVAYLIEAYRRFESVCHRPPLGPDETKMLESAIADIQLFGTPTQVSLVREFVQQYSIKKIADVDSLLSDLRKDLRFELGLKSSPDDTFFLRVTFNDIKDNKSKT